MRIGKPDKTLFTDKRWNEPLKPRTVGEKVEFTEEEKKEIEKETEEMLRFYGVLKPDEEYHLGDFDVPKKEE
jgi:hypothetical protein